jgi:Tle cognate immunity protein 4 C-terminal domain/Tle cognate immunity protein 4 N-terminal domain
MRWPRLLTAGCLALWLSACHRTESLTSQEQAIVAQWSTHLKPHCVGRYLIDMPDDASLSSQQTKVQGVTVEAQAMPQADYQKAMEARSKVLQATKHFEGYQFLYADGEINGIQGSRYFISLGDRYEISDSNRVIEAYKWDRGYQIKLKIEGSDFTNSIYKDTPAYKMDPVKTDVPGKLRWVVSLLDTARGRADDDIPTEPGFCIMGGFLPGKATDQEDIATQFVLRDQQGVSFNLSTSSAISEPNTLLQRGGDINEALSQNEGRTIRKGHVDLPGMPAEEWLMSGLSPQNVPGHFMMLEANSKIGSAQTPLLILNLYNDSQGPAPGDDGRFLRASLSEGEAIALWDVVSRTLRPRPNGF